MRSAAEIDTEGLAREARDSEHNEAYKPMGKIDGISVGVGARASAQGKPVFFIEVLIPVCSGSEVDLDRLGGRLEILRRLEERSYSLTCQDDMSFSCELVTRKNDLENEYTRVIRVLDRCAPDDDPRL